VPDFGKVFLMLKYADMQLFAEIIALPPSVICIKCYDFERPMNSSSHFVILN
jgi:hypothetical protein